MVFVTLKGAAKLLKAGEVVAFPTETVYGLGALAADDGAVAKVYELKNRPTFNPLIVHVASLAQAKAYGKFPPLAEKLAAAFWPGPITLVVPQNNGQVSKLATAGLDTVALRLPAHGPARQLIRAVGAPLVAPSANPSGRLSATCGAHVESLFHGAVPLLPGAVSPVGLESTIVDCTGDVPVILRLGGMPPEQLEAITPGAVLAAKDSPIKAPGMALRHYAPRLPLSLNRTQPRPHHAFVAFGPFAGGLPPGAQAFSLTEKGDLTEAAAKLFGLLHHIDAVDSKFLGIDVMPIPDEGLGKAINDRLRRGAGECT